MSAVVWTKGTVLRGLSDQEPLTEAPSLRTPADSFLPVCKLTEAVFPTKAWKAPPRSSAAAHCHGCLLRQACTRVRSRSLEDVALVSLAASLASATSAAPRPWAFEDAPSKIFLNRARWLNRPGYR